MRTVASVDIGTDKIVALIGEVDSYGDIHIIGVGETASRGIYRGFITKLGAAARAIATAVREAEEMSGQKVSEVFINVSGQGIKSQNEKDTINISPSPVEVQEEHVDRLLERSIAKGREDGYEIVHTVPTRYTLDDQEGVEDPVGLIGSRLTAQVHIVKVSLTLSRNLERAVSSAGFEASGKAVGALASAKAVLREEELEEGVLLIDMGAGLTDFVLFLEGNPVVTGCVPFAGGVITRDIVSFMRVDQEEAERIKREEGSALVELVNGGDTFRIRPRGESREFSLEKSKLAEVIQVRLEEIMDKVVEEISGAGFKLDAANAGVVVTGGTANLRGIKEFLERFTELPARVGMPEGVIGLKEKIEDPKYATAVGLLKYAVSRDGLVGQRGVFSENNNVPTLKGIITKVREFLREIL